MFTFRAMSSCAPNHYFWGYWVYTMRRVEKNRVVPVVATVTREPTCRSHVNFNSTIKIFKPLTRLTTSPYNSTALYVWSFYRVQSTLVFHLTMFGSETNAYFIHRILMAYRAERFHRNPV